MHYGTPQKFPGDPNGSGRYREGSGNNPYQHDGGLPGAVKEFRKEGLIILAGQQQNFDKEFLYLKRKKELRILLER